MAPRISHRVFEAIVRLDDRSRPIAETYRRVAAEAEELGLTRPSYQRIRVLVHESRSIGSGSPPPLTAGEVFRLITAPLVSVDDGFARLDRLGMHGAADWYGVPERFRYPSSTVLRAPKGRRAPPG